MLVLVAAGLIIYGQTVSYPFIGLDDPGYVYLNQNVSTGLSWANIRWAFVSFDRSNWHPLTWLSLMLDAQVYGLNAGGYHLTNLLLHLANGVLLFAWLRRATRVFWPAALTAFFFIAHPLHVESVAWVTERKDVLSLFFFCLTLLAYTRYVFGGGRWFYGVALLLCALGLAAKPMLVTLPPLLLLLDFWPLGRFAAGTRASRSIGWLLVEKIPFAILVAASCVVTFLAQRSQAVVAFDALPVSERIASALLGYGTYLEKTLLPVGLGVFYPYWQQQTIVAPLVVAILLLLLVGISWRIRKGMPWVLVGWCWFLGTLVPVIGLVQVGGQAIADRYMYLPHIGLFIAVFWTGAVAWESWPRAHFALSAATAAAAVACVGMSWQQTRYWSSSSALFGHTLTLIRPVARVHHLFGDALLAEGRRPEAEAAYKQALALDPEDPFVGEQLGIIQMDEQRWPDVVATLERPSAGPRATAAVLNDYALALLKTGHGDQAEKAYRRAVVLEPDYVWAHFGLADILYSHGDTVGAAEQYQIGLTLRDDWIPGLSRLAEIYTKIPTVEAHESAVTLARRATDLSGGRDLESMDALAAAQAATGRWDDAVNSMEAALAIAGDPNAPPGAAAFCREQLKRYREHRLGAP